MNNSSKTLFFLICAMGCFWLVLSEFYGKKFLSTFINNILKSDNKTEPNTIEIGGKTHNLNYGHNGVVITPKEVKK